MMTYTEFKTVEKPIIEWLQGLDWKYISPDELKRDTEETFDLPTLQAAIKKLNPETIKTDEDVEKVVNQLRRFSNDIRGNKEFFEWLKGERSLVLKPGEKARTIRLVDFENIENNVFVATNQFKFSGYEDVRFDIILMVNGLPLLVMEAKAPTREIFDYHEAIKQISRYQKQAPQIFKYIAFTCVTDGLNFRYGVTENKFFQWKNSHLTDQLEPAIKEIFNKQTFLDLIANFIIFEKEREETKKKITMHNQFSAANKIFQRVLTRQEKTGLIWHFQGSGKTLTMLFAAWKLKKAPQLNNPTILVIVDRIDLESQHWGTFANVDLPYTAKALNTKDFIGKLKRESREVIITTIQKFERVEEVLSKRENIIIFIDEAHRTQYGKLAMYMRQAFPNAIIFGFTGTPIDKGPLGKSTFRTFCPPGEKYLDRYSIKQSIEDGATVPISYLPRPDDFYIPKDQLDKEFFSITLGLSDEEQEKVLDKSATLKTALKSKDRINKIAKDIAEHYKTHIEPNGFKAQLVAVDRETCALYKEALDKYLPAEYSVVIFTPNPNDEEFLKRLVKDEKEKERLIKKVAQGTFQKPNENPKIIIVTDMLLTGFDAPIEQVMYFDKPLRDHKLIQAIARTNRPYPGKTVGIIVDYVGIFDNLMKALNFEAEDIEGIAYNFDILRKEFTQTVTELLEMFKDIKRDDTRESLFNTLRILEDQEKLKQFKTKLVKLKRLYETIAPDTFLLAHIKDYQWLLEINASYNKVFNRKYEHLLEYETKTKQLIREQLLIERIDKEIPTFTIDQNYLDHLQKKSYSNEQKIMEMKHALDYHIKINLETNPIYETLSQRLQRILKTQDKTQLLHELENITKEILTIDEEAKRLGLTKEEHALLSVLKKYAKQTEEKELIDFTKDLLKDIKPDLFPGWHRKSKIVQSVQRKVFDKSIQKFNEILDAKTILSMTEELTGFIIKHNE